MRYSAKILLGILLCYLGFVLYHNRALFFSIFDATYWKDKYDHSQWQLPLSPRVIGDDGLYLHEGYQLVHGADPTAYNPEVPPLGKYLIGASILGMGNGHWFGFFSTLLAIGAFFLLAQTILASRLVALAATLLFTLDPLVTSQFPLTMLDSLQMAWGILTLWMLTKIAFSRQLSAISLIMLGIFFGLFAATKAPIFSPLMAGVIALTLLGIYRSILPHMVTFGTALVVYFVPYIPYFLTGHTLIDWLRVQKWILAAYRGNYISPNVGSVFTNLLFNQHQNLFTKAWEPASIWTGTWPILLVASLISFVLLMNEKTPTKHRYMILPIARFLLLSLGFLSIIPFWTRYLLAILPFLYILTAYTATRKPLRHMALPLCGIMIGINALFTLPILFPTPEATVKQIIYNWKHGLFQDLYEETTIATKSSIDRTVFHRFGLEVYDDAHIEAVEITIGNIAWERWSNTQSIPIHITYTTRYLGSFREDHTLPLVKEHGRWRIVWQWDLLLHNLAFDHHLETAVLPAKRGSIRNHTGATIAADTPTFLISVTPAESTTHDEVQFLQFLQSMLDGKVSAVALHQRLVGNALGDRPIPLGVIPFTLDETRKKLLMKYPQILLSSAFYRTAGAGTVENTHYKECCSHLYSTTNYSGTAGLEKKYDTLLKGYNGGSLVIKDAEGNIVRTILSVEKKDGEDVQL